MNQVILVGNVSTDVTLRDAGNTPVSNFNVATNSFWKDKEGNEHTQAEFHRIVCWGPLAKVCGAHLKKGRLICVTGKIQSRTYEKDGVEKNITEINAANVEFLGKKEI